MVNRCLRQRLTKVLFNSEMAKGCRTSDSAVNVIIVFFLSYADFCIKGL